MSRPCPAEKLVDDFIRLLEFWRTGPDRFTSLHIHPYTRHLYGGQAVAQAMRAAATARGRSTIRSRASSTGAPSATGK